MFGMQNMCACVRFGKLMENFLVPITRRKRKILQILFSVESYQIFILLELVWSKLNRYKTGVKISSMLYILPFLTYSFHDARFF